MSAGRYWPAHFPNGDLLHRLHVGEDMSQANGLSFAGGVLTYEGFRRAYEHQSKQLYKLYVQLYICYTQRG